MPNLIATRAETILDDDWYILEEFCDFESMRDFLASPSCEIADYTVVKSAWFNGFFFENSFISLDKASKVYRLYPYESSEVDWISFWTATKNANLIVNACIDIISRKEMLRIVARSLLLCLNKASDEIFAEVVFESIILTQWLDSENLPVDFIQLRDTLKLRVDAMLSTNPSWPYAITILDLFYYISTKQKIEYEEIDPTFSLIPHFADVLRYKISFIEILRFFAANYDSKISHYE